MRMLTRTLIAGVLMLSVAGSAGAALVYPSVSDTGAGEILLYNIYNELYGTSLTSNVQLVDTYALDSSVVPVTEDSIVTLEAAWMNAYFTQDIGVYTTSGGAPDYSVLAALPWHDGATIYTGMGDLRGQGLEGSFSTSESFHVADFAYNPGDIVPISSGGPIDGIDMFTWYSEPPRNLVGNVIGWNEGDPHMIIFTTPTPGTYLVAIEDLPLEFELSHSDYNDFLIEVRVEPIVPEPASMALLGLGLAGLAVRYRKAAKR